MTLRSYSEIMEENEEASQGYELRQEAIEHIKFLSKDLVIKGVLHNANAEVYWQPSKKSVRYKLAQIDWIKYFFNISEEELK